MVSSEIVAVDRFVLDGGQYGNDDTVDFIAGAALPLAYNALPASVDHNCCLFGHDAFIHILG